VPETLRRACPVFGCGQQAPCPLHARIKVGVGVGYRADNRAYKSARWLRVRARVLRQHPLCGDRPPGAPDTTDSECRAAGRLTPGHAVDHIVPHHGLKDPRMWSEKNYQVLCARCHGAKGRREQLAMQGSGRRG
jgi:5-methylcytosine-specific restriction endonuclease McrA